MNHLGLLSINQYPETSIEYPVSRNQHQKKVDIFLSQLNKNPYAPQVDITLESDLLNQLIEQQKVVKTSDGVFFSKAAYDEGVKKITDYIKSKGKVNVGEVRDMLKTSRKYAMALVEYLDEKKITKRIGDDRVLR